MSLHADLLKQALHLATKEPRCPAQAGLRRSMSASCYVHFTVLWTTPCVP